MITTAFTPASFAVTCCSVLAFAVTATMGMLGEISPAASALRIRRVASRPPMIYRRREESLALLRLTSWMLILTGISRSRSITSKDIPSSGLQNLVLEMNSRHSSPWFAKWTR